jgi:hypothetical protein
MKNSGISQKLNLPDWSVSSRNHTKKKQVMVSLMELWSDLGERLPIKDV